jgi:hypothetical protein
MTEHASARAAFARVHRHHQQVRRISRVQGQQVSSVGRRLFLSPNGRAARIPHLLLVIGGRLRAVQVASRGVACAPWS